jgi:hypothetical protein
MHPCAYLLENVPPWGEFRLIILARWQQLRLGSINSASGCYFNSLMSPSVLMDVD